MKLLLGVVVLGVCLAVSSATGTVRGSSDGGSQAPMSMGSGTKFSRVHFRTTKGDFYVEVHPEWSQLGAGRFMELVKSGFFNDNAFFRVLPDFIVQWGLSGDSATNQKWRLPISDDPASGISNSEGTITFAKAGANSRTTQVFVNYVDNARLDDMGFTPFGVINKEGMTVLKSLYSGYGEGAPSGNGPDQGAIREEGNAYLKKDFPQLDYIVSAEVMG